jgi:UDP-N-acetylglucosamine 2-epimerase (non-hydrolysing)
MVVGTRPEILKMLPVKIELEKRGIQNLFISTGQQRELTHQTFESLKFSPDRDLNLMRENQDSAGFISEALSAIGSVIKEYDPSVLLVQGDTSTALAAALAGYTSKVKVGHIEAGLRSNDLYAPWPEEGFRRLIDSISSILWFPTKSAVRVLETDQIGLVTGNTIVDMLRIRTGQKSDIVHDPNRILVTLHRREAFGTTLEKALTHIKQLASNTGFEFIFIEHPNPNIRGMLEKVGFTGPNLKIMKPLPYLEFIDLMSNSGVVITDSGGLQEEARSLQVPLLVMRDNSERMEALNGKQYRLTPPDGSNLTEDLHEVLSFNKESHAGSDKNPFGDGFSAERIVDGVIESFKK